MRAFPMGRMTSSMKALRRALWCGVCCNHVGPHVRKRSIPLRYPGGYMSLISSLTVDALSFLQFFPDVWERKQQEVETSPYW